MNDLAESDLNNNYSVYPKSMLYQYVILFLKDTTKETVKMISWDFT